MSANRCDANALRANRDSERRTDPGVLRSGENNSFSFRCAHDREAPHDLVHGQFEHVERADEVRDERRGRMLVDLARAAYLLDLPAVHDCDAVGHRKRLVLVVGDVHERRSQLGLDPLQLELHLLTELYVQRTQRFVEQQRGRLVDERAGQRHALLLAAGKLPRAPVLEPLELDDAQDLEHTPAVLLPGNALHLEPERDVVVDRHVREERVLLEHHVDGSSVREDRRDVLVPEGSSRPSSGTSNPAIIRSVVVFPHPLGPRSEKNSPSRIASVTSRTASASPKRLLTFSSAIAMLVSSAIPAESNPLGSTPFSLGSPSSQAYCLAVAASRRRERLAFARPIVARDMTPATANASVVPPTCASQPASRPPTGASPRNAKR